MRDVRQDRFLNWPAQNFNPLGTDQGLHSLNVGAAFRQQPFQQWSRNMQDERELWVLLDHVQERLITLAVSGFKDASEIADRLMVMQTKDHANGRHEKPR